MAREGRAAAVLPEKKCSKMLTGVLQIQFEDTLSQGRLPLGITGRLLSLKNREYTK